MLLWFGMKLWAQPVPLPPAHSETDHLEWLTSSKLGSNFSFSHERRYQWANNVISLKEGERKTLPTYQVTTSAPFYTADNLSRWELRYSQWGVEVVEGTVSLLQGNADAAQLWLDAKSNAINKQRFYHAFARERKGHWRWLGLSYTTPFKNRETNGELTLSLSYLSCHRFRDGWLSGTHHNGRMLGEVNFISSRGIGFEAPSGKGFALDLIASIKQGNWRALTAVESLLGRVRWKRLRKVSAFIDTNSFTQDPEGFIRSLPSLVGREEFVPLKRSIDKQWALGLGYRKSRWTLGAVVAERLDGHNWHLGAVWSPTNCQRVLFDFQIPLKAVSIGYSLRNLSVILTASRPDPTDSLTLGLQVRLAFQR